MDGVGLFDGTAVFANSGRGGEVKIGADDAVTIGAGLGAGLARAISTPQIEIEIASMPANAKLLKKRPLFLLMWIPRQLIYKGYNFTLTILQAEKSCLIFAGTGSTGFGIPLEVNSPQVVLVTSTEVFRPNSCFCSLLASWVLRQPCNWNLS